MTKKKFRTRLASELRKKYNFEFVESIKIAKAVLEDEIETTNKLLDLGYRIQREYVSTCARKCCYEYGECFYYGETQKESYIEFKYKDLKLIRKTLERK